MLLSYTVDCKNYQISMIRTIEVNRFYFAARHVCNKFLKNVFHLTGDFLSFVNGSSSARESPMEEYPHYGSPAPVQERTVAFLGNIANSVGDVQPDSDEIHLPYLSKKVYKKVSE